MHLFKVKGLCSISAWAVLPGARNAAFMSVLVCLPFKSCGSGA